MGMIMENKLGQERKKSFFLFRFFNILVGHTCLCLWKCRTIKDTQINNLFLLFLGNRCGIRVCRSPNPNCCRAGRAGKGGCYHPAQYNCCFGAACSKAKNMSCCKPGLIGHGGCFDSAISSCKFGVIFPFKS